MARTSKCNPRTRHGAIIVKGGRILANAVNRNRNDTVYASVPGNAYAYHAEIRALKMCGNTNLKGATIYVARVGKKGFPMMSKPCPACQKALKEAGIVKVVYTIESQMSL